MTTKLTFEIEKQPRKREGVSATKYWIALELPIELCSLTMRQLTALRRMVVKAYGDGRNTK